MVVLRAEEARKCAEDRASELEVRVSRMTQSVKDAKVANGEAKNNLRHELAECKQRVESLTVRVAKAETRCKVLNSGRSMTSG